MATALVAAPPPDHPTTVAKKPSIKKYRAPTPPKKAAELEDDCDAGKDKENDAAVQPEDAKVQERSADLPDEAPPAARRLGAGDPDRSSVLSRAAMFETGSPRARDPAEMSLRERKALFEKNKGAAIVPKAPFGLAPPAKALRTDNRAQTAVKPPKPAVVAQSTKALVDKPDHGNGHDDDSGQPSLGGGIRGKLAALLNKERTISETTIAGKYKLEREREMEMLQNRFHHVKKRDEHESDNENEHELSEEAPLMGGSTASLSQLHKKPEIIGQVPKVKFQEKSKSSNTLHDEAERASSYDERVVGSQPVKRRSSQDSPVVLSVLEDVKRIRVNNERETPQSNGTGGTPHSNGVAQTNGIYPHLSDIETDSSNRNDDNTDCGGRCGHYALECVFFFLCI